MRLRARAVHKFSKVPFSFEEWCYEQLIFGIKDGLEYGNLDDFFPKVIDGKHLIEAYGLDKVFDFKKNEKN